MMAAVVRDGVRTNGQKREKQERGKRRGERERVNIFL